MSAGKFTVDVEDWFHCLYPQPRQWEGLPRRCHVGVDRLLRLLDNAQVKATFFVLGDVALHQPDVVRRIAAAGHEVGSHSMNHHFVTSMTPEAFEADLRRSIELISDITGAPVRAYRAPYFSINDHVDWAFDILAANGITQDSSVFPGHAPRYGNPTARKDPHEIRPGMMEWPISVGTIGNTSFPIVGGAYFRILPFWLTRWMLERHRLEGLPLNFYVHPWELDHEQPRVRNIPGSLRLRHYYALSRTEDKLKKLLEFFEF